MQLFQNVLHARIPSLLFVLSIGFSLLFFTPGLSARPGYSSDMGVSENEFLALSALYEKTDGDRWFNNTNWLSPPVSDWHGVTVTNGTVTELVLSENNLSGHLPPELGNLSNLIILALDHNHITGEIPPELGELSNLLLLSLWSNQLSGTIPPELGSLSKLELLSLSENKLSGPVPSELGNLSKLQALYLDRNHLSGEIPRNLANLSDLQVLYLSGNALSGNIPSELTRLTNLNPGMTSISYNKLMAAGPFLPAFLDEYFEGWQLTQTITPNIHSVIRYALPEQTAVRLEVFDAVGRHVATLVNESIPPGKHEVHFDASGLSSGVYLYQLQSSSSTKSRRMLLVR